MKYLNYLVKTIYVTEELAPIIIVAAPSVDLDLVKKLKRALLEPSFEEEMEISLFAPQGGFLAYNPVIYERVRQNIQSFEQ
jgi:hypothetical protein